MVVLILSACPVGLRGFLTRWLLEVSAGVFIGHVSRRIREQLWEATTSMIGSGRALMVFTARTEQRFDYRVHGHHWQPTDFEGVTLMLRPADPSAVPPSGSGSPRGPGWSNAAKRRRFGR